jgi:hypothetical protein
MDFLDHRTRAPTRTGAGILPASAKAVDVAGRALERGGDLLHVEQGRLGGQGREF